MFLSVGSLTDIKTLRTLGFSWFKHNWLKSEAGLLVRVQRVGSKYKIAYIKGSTIIGYASGHR
jgi:hypothetical protein